jgi:hypothetical protein
MTVSANEVGNPTGFMWGASTFYRSTSADGSSGWHAADRIGLRFSPSP